MKLSTLLLVSGLALTGVSSLVYGAEPPTSEQSARAHFDALVDRLHDAHAEYERLFLQAVNEARVADDGKAHADTKARVLSARDRYDLIMEQLMLMSARYGWVIPDPPTPQDEAAAEAEAQSEQAEGVRERDAFEAVDVLLARHFKVEASRIARTVKLPATPIATSRGR
jgi:hypothetical protein